MATTRLNTNQVPVINCALQVEVTYNNELTSGASVTVGDTTKTTKGTGVVLFTNITPSTVEVSASKDGFLTQTVNKTLADPMEEQSFSLQPIEVTFTIKDENGDPLYNASIVVDEETKTTDVNGQVTFYGLLDGEHSCTISLLGYTTYTGTLTINRQSFDQVVVLEVAAFECYATTSFAIDDTTKINAGVGDSQYDYDAYPSDTDKVNVLTLTGTVKSNASTGEMVKVSADEDNSTITVVADEDDTELELNNNNIINTVVAKINTLSTFLCFKKGNDLMYFENNTKPFFANKSLNAASKQYTYFTYSGGVMTSHTGNTSSNTQDKANSFDGTTLIIDSIDDLYSNGTWTRYSTGDVELESTGADISLRGYLTEITPYVPNDIKKVKVVNIDTSIWKQSVSFDGQRIENVPSGFEFFVQKTMGFSIISTKIGSTLAKDTYVKNFFNINNNYTVLPFKYEFIINDSSSTFADTKTKIWIGDSIYTQIYLGEYTGVNPKVNAYAGDVITYEISKSGYATQKSTYTVPLNATSYTNNITLVQD